MSACSEFWVDVEEDARLDRARRAFRRKLDAGTATRADLRALLRQFGRTFGWHGYAVMSSRRMRAGRRGRR